MILPKFTRDTITTILNRGLEAVFSLILSVIIARTLGAEGKGIYTLAIMFPSLLLIFCNLGITSASVYYTAKNNYKTSEILTGNTLLTILISLLATILGIIVILYFSNILLPNIDSGYLFTALALAPCSIFFDYLANIVIGLQKLIKYNIIYLIKNVLFLTFAIIVLLGFKLHISAVILSQSLALIIGGILYFFTIKKMDGKFPAFNFNYIKNVVYFGFKTYLANIVTYLQYRVNFLLLNIYQSPVSVGFYSVATQLSESTWLIPRSVGTVLAPIIASDTKDSFTHFTPMICRIVLILITFASILIFIFSNFIVIFLYSTDFINAVIPLRILLIGSVAFCGQIILVNAIIAYGKPMIIAIISVITLCINIGLNILLIPQIGINGAAWASSISNTIAFLSTSFVYSRMANINILKLFKPQISDFIYIKNVIQGALNAKKS